MDLCHVAYLYRRPGEMPVRKMIICCIGTHSTSLVSPIPVAHWTCSGDFTCISVCLVSTDDRMPESIHHTTYLCMHQVMNGIGRSPSRMKNTHVDMSGSSRTASLQLANYLRGLFSSKIFFSCRFKWTLRLLNLRNESPDFAYVEGLSLALPSWSPTKLYHR
jgi:hypothetical protein